MYDVHDFVNNELSTQYQLEGITQLCFRLMYHPLYSLIKVKFR